jgi:hypothetical protein
LTVDIQKYTLFANSSMAGIPPVRALFYEFPDEPELFTVDRQWLVGSDILVTPVLTPGASAVEGKRISLTITTATDVLPPRYIPWPRQRNLA